MTPRQAHEQAAKAHEQAARIANANSTTTDEDRTEQQIDAEIAAAEAAQQASEQATEITRHAPTAADIEAAEAAQEAADAPLTSDRNPSGAANASRRAAEAHRRAAQEATMTHTHDTTDEWGIRIGGEWLSRDDDEGWTGDSDRARRFATREQADTHADEIAAALEDGLDDEIRVDRIDANRRPQGQAGFVRSAFLLVMLLVVVVLGTIGYSAYRSITRFAESVSYPERVSRSIR